MSCPKCGLQTLPEQKFCRSCGASLQITTRPLARPAVSDAQRMPQSSPGPNTERTNRLVLWGFVIMFAGAAIGVIGKKLIYEDLVTVVGVLTALAGMFLAVYPFLSPARARHQSSRTAELEELAQPQLPKALGAQSATAYVPSITERTTDLLGNSQRQVQKRIETEGRSLND